MPEQNRHYLLCGWRVRSALELPELPPWPTADAAGAAADVLIEEAQLPDRLDPSEPEGTWLSIGADGSVLLQVLLATRQPSTCESMFATTPVPEI